MGVNGVVVGEGLADGTGAGGDDSRCAVGAPVGEVVRVVDVTAVDESHALAEVSARAHPASTQVRQEPDILASMVTRATVNGGASEWFPALSQMEQTAGPSRILPAYSGGRGRQKPLP